MDRNFGVKAIIAISIIAAIMFAAPSIGRFAPTHKIEQPVYCGSCHPEQVDELSETTHLAKFADYIDRSYSNATGSIGTHLPAARATSGGCMMCHNFWENMKWFGVKNVAYETYDSGELGLATPTDIYGNPVSPYGLGSTNEYAMKVNIINTSSIYDDTKLVGISASDSTQPIAFPWKAGLDTYEYTVNGIKYDRVDYVWSKLSSLSPGPVGFIKVNSLTGATASCGQGSAEHGMCHIARDAVAESFGGKRSQVQEDPNPGGATGPNGTGAFVNRAGGAGDFFRHEMAFTTAQYAAKPVKICGACHVFKLPPMKWGGEPWSISDINFAEDRANAGNVNDDPFGFRPEYNDLTGTSVNVTGGHALPSVMFRTSDFAHSNVPCIRCHAHAGINGDTVTENPINGAGSPASPKQVSLVDPATGANVTGP